MVVSVLSNLKVTFLLFIPFSLHLEAVLSLTSEKIIRVSIS